ncbi:MAG: methylenetetrahydrofolate reductase C-terminal domain-containing protein [Deltaproteobacteria bacterium]
MIISELKPIEEIIDSLKDFQKVFLIGCGDCATACKSGGEAELAALEGQLKEKGKTVTGRCIPPSSCVSAKLKTELAKNMAALRGSEAILVLACGSGVQSVKENDRLGLTVLPACNTLSGAILDSKGDLYERCSMCGECVLAFTGGICPVTRCSKGILNGPCGGMDKGKCELDKERDCAWVLIYKEMEKRGKLDVFRKIRAARDHKKNVRPHQLKTSQAAV